MANIWACQKILSFRIFKPNGNLKFILNSFVIAPIVVGANQSMLEMQQLLVQWKREATAPPKPKGLTQQMS